MKEPESERAYILKSLHFKEPKSNLKVTEIITVILTVTVKVTIILKVTAKVTVNLTVTTKETANLPVTENIIAILHSNSKSNRNFTQ